MYYYIKITDCDLVEEREERYSNLTDCAFYKGLYEGKGYFVSEIMKECEDD